MRSRDIRWRHRSRRGGFTLIELLIVIGIIGTLSAIVLTAVNPRRQLASAEDARRNAAVKEIQSALYQYMIDTSALPAGIGDGEENTKPICRLTVSAGSSGCVSLDALVPTYIVSLPIDPSETDTNVTGYRVYTKVGRPTAEAVYKGGTFLPTQLSGLIGWYRADAATYQDTGGATVAGANNDPVGLWRNQAGSANHFQQGTASRRPVLITGGINGKPVLRVAAASQQTMIMTANMPAPYTVLYVARQSGPTRGRVLTAMVNNWLLGWHGGAQRSAYFDGWVTNGPAADSNPHLFAAIGTGTMSSVYENGTLLASNANGVSGPNGFSLSGYAAISEFSDADIAEIVVYGRALTDTQRKQVEQYLKEKYGL